MYVRRATRAADPAYRRVQPRPAPRKPQAEAPPAPGSPAGEPWRGGPGGFPAAPRTSPRRVGGSARAAGGLDDLGDDDLGDPTCVLLAGVAVLAKFGAHVAGHDVGWGVRGVVAVVG